jgi:hypothetical protein
VGADRAAQGGALQGAAGEPHLRRCRESIPRGRRQLSFTFTYSSDWWRLKWLVFFFTILGWGSGFGIASAYAAQDSLCLRVVVLLGVALVRSMRSTPTRIEYFEVVSKKRRNQYASSWRQAADLRRHRASGW